MLRNMTAKQFAGWEHFASLEPFGELRMDYRIASVVQMIANVNRGKDQKPFTLDDVVLKFGEENRKPPQPVEQKVAVAYALATAFNKMAQREAKKRKK